MRSVRPWLKGGAAFIAAVPFVLASTVALGQTNPNSTTLPNGANLEVEIDSPGDSTEFKVPAAAGAGGTINVPIAATGSVGLGSPNIHITFVVDVSGSTNNPCGGGLGLIIDCEKQAVTNVLSDPNITSVSDVGVTVFAGLGGGPEAAAADMDPGLGSPAITSVIADAQTVVNSIFVVTGSGATRGVAQFTNTALSGAGTNFTAGLTAANTSVAASGATTKRVFFLSDGQPFPAFPSVPAFDAAVAALGGGVVIDSFAVGQNAVCGNPVVVSLQRMADATSGTCTAVPNPANLPSLLPNLVATSLDDVQIAVDGGGVATGGCLPGLPAAGPVGSTCSANPSLGVGDHDIEATADGSDNAGIASVTANSVEIHLLQLTATPPTETNELGSDNSHTMTVAIAGGTGPARNINFSITAGPTSGANFSAPATPGGASVALGYTVPVAPASLGTDTIVVSTSIAGMVDTVTLEKIWEDTTPPVVTADLVCVGDDDDGDSDDGDNDDSDSDSDVAGDDDQCGDDDAHLLIVCTATDDVDPNPVVTAVLQVPGVSDIPVTDGQVFGFEFDDETEVETEDGILEIEGPGVTLECTATDGSSNTATATAVPDIIPDD